MELQCVLFYLRNMPLLLGTSLYKPYCSEVHLLNQHYLHIWPPVMWIGAIFTQKKPITGKTAWSRWHPSDISLTSRWDPTDIPLMSSWHLAEIPLTSRWNPTDIPLTSHWHPADISLTSRWHPTDIPDISGPDFTCVRLLTSLSSSISERKILKMDM